jgi:hypothetical protein
VEEEMQTDTGTTYRGFDIHKDGAGYFFKDAGNTFHSGYFPTEDKAMDAIDALRRQTVRS